MATPRVLGTVDALFAAWHAVYGRREVTVHDVMATTNRALRKAIQAATKKEIDKSGNSLGGYLRKAVMNPVPGWEVIGRRDPALAHPPMLWSVRPTGAIAPVPVANSQPAGDDDRLLGVLSKAMGERVITGTQADRLLALWCEVEP
jgi:hypothetical protein